MDGEHDESLQNQTQTEPNLEPTENPEPQEQPTDTPTEKPKKSRRKLWLLGIIGVVVVAALVAYLLVFLPNHQANKVSTQPTQTSLKKDNSKSSATPVSAEEQMAKFVTPTTGEVWLKAPKKVQDLGYVSGDDDKSTTYYQLGTRGQDTIYMSDTQTIGDDLMIYEVSPDGSVRAILHPDANETYSRDFDQQTISDLPSKIVADTTTHYDSLSPPNSFVVNGSETATIGQDGYTYLGEPDWDSSADDSMRTETVQAYGGSTLVRVTRTYKDTGLTAINYALDTPIHTRIYLNYQPISTNLSSYSWKNDLTVPNYPETSVHSSLIGGIVRGCGSISDSVSRDDVATDSDFVPAGTTASGQTVYAFKDNSDPIVKKAYSEYKESYSGTSIKTVSEDDFLKQHALVAFKNAAGEWLIYTRNEFAAVGGCAKPVIYLYPSHLEAVSVHVGAQVTKADPYYDPASGWNVIASPDGKLLADSRTYDSLFWEGQGYGLYPGIVAGTVVKRAEALNTIKAQLGEQGLTRTEAGDFIDFWKDKIPNKPYVRLTWLNTAQMNRLAPLAISPKPDTLIRVFLDMEGFDYPVSLPAQQLTATPRTGFTVVEWGGLTQNKLR